MRGRLLAALLACTAVLVAGAAVAPASVAAQEDGSASAEIEYVNGQADAEQVEVTPDDGTLTFTAPPVDANGSDLVRSWSIEGDAAGELKDNDPYPQNLTVQYDVSESDVGSSFDVVLTVATPDGTSATDSVTVSVVANETDPGPDPGPTNVTTDIEYVDGQPGLTQIEATPADGTLTFFGTATTDANVSQLDRTWSIEGDAAGSLQYSETYGGSNFSAQYDVTEADVGNSFDVVLTVTAPDGTSATDSATVSVVANESDPGPGQGNETPTERHVDVHLNQNSLETGETTNVSLVLEEVPEAGFYGATVDLSLDGEVAEFTGNYRSNGAFTLAHLDMEANEGDHTTTFTVNDTQDNVGDDATSLFLGTVEIEAVGGGDTLLSTNVTELANEDDEDVPATISRPRTLTVSSANSTVAADIQYVGTGSLADQISVDASAENATFYATVSDSAYNTSEITRAWSVNASATGTLHGAEAYPGDFVATYEFGADDVGQPIEVYLEVTNPAGDVTVTSVAVSVVDDSDSSDGNETGSGDGGDGSDGSSGGGFLPPSDGGDGTDGGSGEGGTDDGGTGESPAEFTLSASSSGESVVISAQNPREGASASTSLDAALGALQLASFEGTAGADADSFEATLRSVQGPSHRADDVVGAILLSDSGAFSSSTVEFAVDESQLADGVGSSDLEVWGMTGGSWTQTDIQIGEDGAAADLSTYDRIAVLEPEGAGDGSGGDSLSGFGIAVVVGLLLAVLAGGYYVRD